MGAGRSTLKRSPLIAVGGLLAIAMVIGGMFLANQGGNAQSTEQPSSFSGPASGSPSASIKVGARVGDTVPDFAMRLADRSTVTSEDLLRANKPVFLYFFATW